MSQYGYTGINLGLFTNLLAQLNGRGSPLRNYDNAVTLASLIGAADFCTHTVHIIHSLWYQYILGTAGNTGSHSQPAGGLAHYLNEDNTAMSAGSITKLVDGIYYSVGSSIRADGIVSAPYIVFNGARNTYYIQTQLAQLQGTSQGTGTTDDNQAFNAMLLQIVSSHLAVLLLHELRAVGCTQHSTAPLDNISHAAGAQLINLILDKALEAVSYTPDTNAVMLGSTDYGTDSRIQARTVVATGQNCNIFQHRILPPQFCNPKNIRWLRFHPSIFHRLWKNPAKI